MANLRDQLLKAGLIDKKAKHLAEQEERQRAKAAKADARIAAELQAAEAEKARRYEEEVNAKKAADRAREAEKLLQLQAAERLHRLESTIDRNQITVREGRRRFYFRAGGKKVGRLDLQERQARALEDGDLCIVHDEGDTAKPYKLMDAAGLAELLSIGPEALMFHAPSWRPIDEPETPAPGLSVTPVELAVPAVQPSAEAPQAPTESAPPAQPAEAGPEAISGVESGTSIST